MKALPGVIHAATNDSFPKMHRTSCLAAVLIVNHLFNSVSSSTVLKLGTDRVKWIVFIKIPREIISYFGATSLSSAAKRFNSLKTPIIL